MGKDHITLKKIILIRHAHRETGADRDRDNGLSDKGQKQAKSVAKFFKEYSNKTDTNPNALYSSPKLRCQETLVPLSKLLNLPIAVEPLLDEPSSHAAMQYSIQNFLEKWIASNENCTVLCSHGDWIPAFVKACTGAHIHCSKASITELEQIHSNQFRLVNLIQNKLL